MKRQPLRIAILFCTILIGISVSAALVVNAQKSKRRQVAQPARVNEPVRQTATIAKTNQRVLEMVFVLDTTGSMGGLLEGAKGRIWGIVNGVMQSPAHPAVRIGLVAYRDRGDAYVTRVLPLTSDLDQVYSTLMDYQAEGGGDEPEDVRRALADGVGRAGWSQPAANITQILFLVGDAPPHNDYQDEPDTVTTTAAAVSKGMIVNTIQCGELDGTKQVWQAIARRGEGEYFAIAQDGGVQAITTPYDERLGELGQELGKTFVAYGGGAGLAGERFRAGAAMNQASTEDKVATAAAPTARAERAVNKAVNTEAYAGDLLTNLDNGTVKLEAIKDADLPSDLQKLSPAARKQEIEKRLDARKKMRAEILTLSKQRDVYISNERRKQTGGKQGAFDTAVSAALQTQLARKGKM
jgi:hypothetical protein